MGTEWTPVERQRVATAVKHRRDDVLGLSQAEAVKIAGQGVSTAVWSNLETGKQASYKQRTKSAVGRALGWTHDSLDRLARGERPELLVQPVTLEEFAALRDRVTRLEDEVRLNAALLHRSVQVWTAAQPAHGVGDATQIDQAGEP